MIRALTLLIWLMAFSSNAATYYIDFVGGSDANAGTSTGAAWKRHPKMANASGVSLSNGGVTPGDIFIFKGGVTWTNSFPMTFSSSGTPGNLIQMKGDSSWYTGGAWSRPVFDGSSNSLTMITFSGNRSNWFLADLEIKNFSCGSGIVFNGVTHTTVSNVYVHQWWTGGCTGWVDLPGPCGSDTCNEQYYGGIRNHAGDSTLQGTYQYRITHCKINNEDGAQNFGYGVTWSGELYYTEIGYVTDNHLHGGHVIAYCDFHHTTVPQAGTCVCHDNTTYLDNFNGRYDAPVVIETCYIYNNYFHDTTWDGFNNIIHPNPGTGSSPANGFSYYIFNNVLVNSHAKWPVKIDMYGASVGNKHKLYIFNNTFQSTAVTSANMVSVTVRGAPPNTLYIWNNLYVSGAGYYGDDGSDAANYSLAFNAQYTTKDLAYSAGYSTNNYMIPTSASGSTVGTGTNLTTFVNAHGLTAALLDGTAGTNRTATTRPSSGNWDIGAYQYTSATAPTITASQTKYGPSGAPLTYQVLSSGGGVVSWGASNLPSGLSMSAGSGVISGTPTVVGTNTVLLAATNGAGWDQETMVIGITNPAALISTVASMAFGKIMEDTTVSVTVSITNAGGTGSTLTGSLTNPTSPWTIVGDAGYTLTNGQFSTKTLSYSPTDYGTNLGSVGATGGGGATIALSGSAYKKLTVNVASRAVETLVESPFATNGNVVMQTIETTGGQGNGLATWGFVPPMAGVITIYGTIIATNLGSDSFFVGINAPPTSDYIWDIIPLTTTGGAAESRQWNARGSGTYDVPEFQPYSFTVEAGVQYDIFLYGREQLCAITNITVSFVETAAPSQSVQLGFPRFKRLR